MITEYLLETHTGAGFHARAACRAIDTDKDGKRISGQTTSVRFVRYK